MEESPKVIDNIEDRPSRKNLILRNGSALLALSIAITLFIHFNRETLSDQNTRVSIGMYLMLLGGIVVTQLDARIRIYKGKMSFGQAFSTGMIFVAFVALTYSLFILIFYLFIAPDLTHEMVKIAENSLRAKGTSEADIQKQMEFSYRIFTPFGMFSIAIIGYLFFGAIFSMIGSLFTMRNE